MWTDDAGTAGPDRDMDDVRRLKWSDSMIFTNLRQAASLSSAFRSTPNGQISQHSATSSPAASATLPSPAIVVPLVSPAEPLTETTALDVDGSACGDTTATVPPGAGSATTRVEPVAAPPPPANVAVNRELPFGLSVQSPAI